MKGGPLLGLAAIAPIMEQVKGVGMRGKTILDMMYPNRGRRTAFAIGVRRETGRAVGTPI